MGVTVADDRLPSKVLTPLEDGWRPALCPMKT